MLTTFRFGIRGLAAASVRVGVGACALVLLAAAPGHTDDEPTDPPFESDGDLVFSLDLAAYRGPSDDVVVQEVYLSISNDQLTFFDDDEKDDGPFEGELQLQLVFETVEGRELASLESTLRPAANSRLDAEDRAILQVIRESVQVPPGIVDLHVELTDLRSQKKGLLNRMRNIKHRGTVHERVTIPDLAHGDLALSDLALVRHARQAEAPSALVRHGIDFDPNPSRQFGLVMPLAKYFVEVYGGQGHTDGDTYLVQSQVMDLGGVPLVERRTRVLPRAVDFALTDELDLDGNVRAGRYVLSLMVLNERTGQATRVQRPFDVMWSVESWGRDPQQLLQEMALIMTDSEYDTLKDLSPGAREVYLAEFWHGLDPTPATAENETLLKFRARIRYADREFDATTRRGIETARGRIFVWYGPPDDVQWEYSSSSFSGQDLVSDPADRASLGTRPSASFLDTEEFLEGDTSGLAEQRGGATVKSKQLEIWTYDGRGDPFRDDRRDFSTSSHRGLKFIFADQMGNGEYDLISTEGAERR